MKTNILVLSFALLLTTAKCAGASERFASTLGTVQREISADRVGLTLRVSAQDKTAEGSIAKLDRLLRDLIAEAAKLKYPESSFTTKSRVTEKQWEMDGRKKVDLGFSSSAVLSVFLVDLTNYGKLLTFVGTREGYEIVHVDLRSSTEGEARRQAIAEALRAARAKAALVAEEGSTSLGKLLEVTEEEVETRSFRETYGAYNNVDPNEGKGVYPIGVFVRVRAKYELVDKQ